MSRFGNHRLYALTASDAERIKRLLTSVDEAIAELLDYRCVRPIDPEFNFPLESKLYDQTDSVCRDYSRIDEPF